MIDNKDFGEGIPGESEAAEAPGNAGTAGEPEPARGGVPLELDTEAIRRLESQLSESKDRHLRLAAEYDNFRKRAAREREELTGRAQAALVVRLLEVLDDLDRVVAGAQGATEDVVQQAVVLVDRKLRKELEAAGLERIDPVGQAFDPGVHEAVSVLPTPSPEADHTVSATFQSGYLFKGTLIRPARVQVYSSEGHA